MKIITLNNNDMQQNIYLYFDESTKEGIIIDPGDGSADIIAAINENGIKIKGILLTHGHFDHIAAANEVKAHTSAQICAHKQEQVMLEDPEINLSVRVGKNISTTADVLFVDGDVFTFASTRLKIIHTPGHTPGCVCYYDEKNAVLFSGDTLFKGSVGRTDLPKSDTNQLKDGIKNKLFSLPSDVVVYPGHGGCTAIGHEKEFNPFV